MAKPFSLIDIFVSQVDAAGKTGPAIDHTDLTVVTVILDNIKDRTEPVEYFAFDPPSAHLLIILVWQCGKAAEAVIDQSDIHSFFSLFFKDIKDRLPHYPVIYDEIFNENKMLCLLQLMHQNRKHIISYLKILCCGILVNRISGILPDII